MINSFATCGRVWSMHVWGLQFSYAFTAHGGLSSSHNSTTWLQIVEVQDGIVVAL
jgi:hypothetical protein